MRRPRHLAIKMKRKGERGSPCLIPHEGRKGRDGIPFTSMEKKEEVIRLIIQRVHIGEKPKAINIF